MFIELESPTLTSPCPLLPAEVGEEFLPAVCMSVPRHSAWISRQLHVCDFANAGGEVDRAALAEALRQAVDDGDRQHDMTDWSEPLVAYDSWLNRRLAIVLRGWGNLVARRGGDPNSLLTLREMEELAEWACQTVQSRSRRMASGSNWCPALDEAGARVLGKSAANGWCKRWQRAVQDVALRHRNLTTMSPWDVFPEHAPADLRFANLLPVLRFADALSFQRDVPFSHWDANEFNNFRERVAAILRCHNGADLVAKQV